jgi:hypothetical protein
LILLMVVEPVAVGTTRKRRETGFSFDWVY